MKNSNSEKSNYFTETFGKKETKAEKSKKQKNNSARATNLRQIEKSQLRGKNSQKNQKPEISKKSDKAFPYEILNHQFDSKTLKSDAQKILKDFDLLLQEVRPLNSRHLQQLPDNIRQLSHQLTDQRSERRLGYMNENIQLSAYVRYYTWWNLVRMTRLFANLPPESFPQRDGICLDLGSGPLTLVNALWLSRPELRKLNLTWYCLDVSQNALTLGEDIYMSIAAKCPANQNDSEKSENQDSENQNHWKIIRIKDSFGAFIKQKADFITCGNMFNELDQTSDMPPEFKVKKYYQQILAYASQNAKFLIVEPGVPKTARTLSLFRDRFLKDGKTVISPCPHSESCPMNGFKSYTGSKNKWCNFAFSTEDAPQKLQKLSENSKLPKERAVLSFLSVTSATCHNTSDASSLILKIASDAFSLPDHKTGFYACSKLGLTLVKTQNPQNFLCGDLVKVTVKTKTPDFKATLQSDPKSGAVIIEL